MGEVVPAAPLPAPRTEDQGTAERLAAAFLLGYQGNTRAAYRRDLTHYGTWCAEHGVDILTATRAHVDAYIDAQHHEEVAPSTIARRLSALSGFYTYAVDEGVLARNPVVRARRPKVGENTQSTGLSRADALALLKAGAEHSPRAGAIVHLLLLCGLRVSELVGADVTDLGYERGHRVLTVVRKGGRRQRMVLPPSAVHALETYLEGREEGPLIATASGNALDRHAIWRLLRRLARTALPHLARTLHPHDLRHACATLALDAGAELRDVQDLLGHADPRTTRRYDRARHNLDRSPSYALAGLLGEDQQP